MFPKCLIKKTLMKRFLDFIAIILLTGLSCLSQDNIHPASQKYEWPDNPLVLEKLEQWRDLKFGMIIHWGLYAVPGIVESWSVCSEDWIYRDSTISYCDYKKWYWGLKDDFNPVNFDPEQWAEAAKNAGMRYVVFTTKHHDGFCMFDTKETNFKVTGGPFAGHAKADVAKYVFQAFREQDFMLGAYFSKPDWHSEYYWWPRYATPDRNNNYNIHKYPWRWEQFKQFTFNQISELMHNYGKIDILWLDGGWVRPLETVNDEVLAWGAPIPSWSQDIDIPRIAEMARKEQPGLLIVDRTVDGKYENYQTPERQVPEKASEFPWESCIPLGNDWGYTPTDKFKTSAEVIHLLVEVVAKGGSLLLGVGPSPEGILLPEQVNKLMEIGKWLKANGEAIYNTRITEHYQDGSTFFTLSKNGKRMYAIYCIMENQQIPSTIEWRVNKPKTGTEIILLGSKEKVKWKVVEEKTIITLPPKVVKSTKDNPALAFSFIIQ